MKTFTQICIKKPLAVFIMILFSLTTQVFAANKIYNIVSNSIFSGGSTYCLNATATALSATFNTCNSGAGSSLATTVTVTWYKNASNLTSGGTQVSQTTLVSTGLGSTIAFSYTPLTTTAGTLYY